MKFNPISKNLYTNSGKLIKQLYCPELKRWSQLKRLSEEDQSRLCTHCNRRVLDTATLSDSGVEGLLAQDATTCLKVGLNQSNIQIIDYEHPESYSEKEQKITLDKNSENH